MGNEAELEATIACGRYDVRGLVSNFNKLDFRIAYIDRDGFQYFIPNDFRLLVHPKKQHRRKKIGHGSECNWNPTVLCLLFNDTRIFRYTSGETM